MRNCCLGLLLFLHATAFCRGPWAASNIPPALLKDATAVIRLYETQVMMKNVERLTIRTHYIVTVLKEGGDELAQLKEMYDRFSAIRSVEGVLFDQNGDKIGTLKKRDVTDVSLVSGSDIAGDARLKGHNFFYRNYPYSVEYSIEIEKKETMFFPQWIPVPGQSVAVERSTLLVNVPASYRIRYRAFNYSAEPTVETKDGRTSYRWQIDSFPAVQTEYAQPAWREVVPCVYIAPTAFVIANYEGNMTDWKSLGYFQSALNNGRDVLPAPARDSVQALVAGVTDQREKVERLYRYLQRTTRYVSIQLGVGGWQPFDATFVYNRKYGDCKALSNYMCALLKEAGITGYYALVRAGTQDDIIADFPSRQFNHVIVCVPEGADTIWLECTSSTTPAGYLGSFTANRHALLITPDGGHLVSTPHYGASENVQCRRIKAEIAADGTLKMKCVTKVRGPRQDDLQMLIANVSKERLKNYLHDRLEFSTYEITSYDYSEDASELPQVTETLNLTVNNYAAVTGKRLFILPDIMTRSDRKLTEDNKRKFIIDLHDEFIDLDTTEIVVPQGYQAEVLPADIMIDNAFGKYECSVKFINNQLFFTRRFEMRSGRFPATDFNGLAQFFAAVYKSDRSAVVLVKEE